MMSKPPPIPPPPPPVASRDTRSDASVRLHWMMVPAILLGLLIAIFFLSSLSNRIHFEHENGDHASGATNSVANLDLDSVVVADNSVGANAEPQSLVATGTNETETPIASAEPMAPLERGSGEGANRQEAVLLIVDEKPASIALRTDARGENLVANGLNPFIGTGTPAASTVYVIDVSGSMQAADRLPRVLSTLKRAVDLLKPEQKFTVILFDQGFYTDPIGNGLQPANNRNKQVIYDWLDSAPGGGGTNPLPAMIAAIQQKPERIVLLSDGEFDPTSTYSITQANRFNAKPARIDCVGLMEEVETLKEIARSNKGIYFQAQ